MSSRETYLHTFARKYTNNPAVSNCTGPGYWRNALQNIVIHKGKENVLPHLQSSLEEVDLRIPLHVCDALQSRHKRCDVISNDTDVIVGLLYYIPLFEDHNLEELWVWAGVGDATRIVPLHILHKLLSPNLCAVLPALHSLTGCDITSKISTKKAALKAEATQTLRRFNSPPRQPHSKMLNTSCWMYHREQVMPKFSLICEQKSFIAAKIALTTTFHPLARVSCLICNANYIIRTKLCNPLDYTFNLNPMFCWSQRNFDMKTIMVSSHLQDHGKLLRHTGLWFCTNSTCPCRKGKVKCTKFCNCQRTSVQNPITVWNVQIKS